MSKEELDYGVIDDFLPLNTFKEIQEILLETNPKIKHHVAWHYLPTVVQGQEKKEIDSTEAVAEEKTEEATEQVEEKKEEVLSSSESPSKSFEELLFEKSNGKYKTLDDVNKVRKIRDVKSEETKLLQTDKRYAVGSIQPFL